jgi:hypothetical protein
MSLNKIIMTLIIHKKATEKEIRETLSKINDKKKSGGLKKHFGLSEKKIDALDFQKTTRNEWD